MYAFLSSMEYKRRYFEVMFLFEIFFKIPSFVFHRRTSYRL